MCLHSITQKVDVLWIDSIVNSIQCLYLHPAVGDTVQGFYVYNIDRSTISRINNIPSGTLEVMFSTTVKVMSCVNNNDQLDSYSAKINFDNKIKSCCKYGVSYTQKLYNIIDELTMDRVESSNTQSTNAKYSDCDGTSSSGQRRDR